MIKQTITLLLCTLAGIAPLRALTLETEPNSTNIRVNMDDGTLVQVNLSIVDTASTDAWANFELSDNPQETGNEVTLQNTCRFPGSGSIVAVTRKARVVNDTTVEFEEQWEGSHTGGFVLLQVGVKADEIPGTEFAYLNEDGSPREVLKIDDFIAPDAQGKKWLPKGDAPGMLLGNWQERDIRVQFKDTLSCYPNINVSDGILQPPSIRAHFQKDNITSGSIKWTLKITPAEKR